MYVDYVNVLSKGKRLSCFVHDSFSVDMLVALVMPLIPAGWFPGANLPRKHTLVLIVADPILCNKDNKFSIYPISIECSKIPFRFFISKPLERFGTRDPL